MRREYKLAADPIKQGRPLTWRREILEITGDGHRQVFAVVLDAEAVDVLEAIRRAYQDGREDNAAMLEAEGRLLHHAEPPLLTSLDSEDYNGPWHSSDVPMVCAACRKPVERTFDDDWQHVSVDDGLDCSAVSWGPVKAMVAAGNENVPHASAGDV